MAEKPTGKKKGKKKRAEPLYVPVGYPVSLGVASFGWAVVGWLVAAFAPRLAFVPGAAALHYLFPAVTVGLLGVNLYFAVRSLLRGAHVLRLLVVTGVEVALFTTLFFQLYAHVGAELYDAPGPTSPWQWFAFSAAHAFRAGDVFDAVEAFGWGIQPVKHVSPAVGVFVVAYHVVVDVFFLGLVWAAVGRFREDVLADDEFRSMLVRLGVVAFAVWFVTWVVVAFFWRPWRGADVPLWFVENVLRVADFADVMESFGLRLHTLPREGVVGVLTFLCRLWIGLGLAFVLTRRRKPPPRRVLTPPGVAAAPYWRLRVGALAGMAGLLFAAGLVGWLASGSAAESLTDAVKAGPDDRADAALRALRRMGPAAAGAVEPLVAARADASPAVRDGITRTLGYLGTSAAAPLRTIALAEPPESAGLAVESLAEVGGAAAPDLVAVWSGTTDDAVKGRADAAIRGVGGAAVAPLIEGFTPENAHGHYVWLQRLDANWRLRGTANPTARACHDLDDLVNRARSLEPAAAAAAMTQSKTCGTAARALLEPAYEVLKSNDSGLQTAAAAVVVAAGPAETPKVLAMARGTPADASVAPGVVAVLNDPVMWSPAVLADPTTLPTLLALVRRPETFPVAVRRLGHYGPAAAPAAAVLIPKVADPQPETRAEARAVLARVSPAWKDGPGFNDALPAFLLRLPQLPPAEADELYAAVKPLTPAQGEAVAGALSTEIREMQKQYRDFRSDDWRTAGEAMYRKAIDGAFAAVERLGPRAKEAAPGLKKLTRTGYAATNDRYTPLVNERVAVSLERLGGSAGDTIPLRMATLGFGPEGMAYLRGKGKAAVPFVRGLFDTLNDRGRLNALRSAAALGPDAEELLPELFKMLPGANRPAHADGADEFWLLGELALTLRAIDPAWMGRPEAEPLGRLLQLTSTDAAAAASRQRVLDLVAAADAVLIPKIAAATIRAGVVDPAVKAVFDRRAPDWRTDPAVKAVAPEMAARVADPWVGDKVQRSVLDLGPTGVEAVGKTLGRLPPDAVAARAGFDKGAGVRDTALRLLAKFDPPPKAAVPALLALAAEPKLYLEAVPLVVAALDHAAPGWAADPAHADAVKAAATTLLGRAAESPLFVAHAGRFGAAVGPELVRQLETARSAPEAADVLERIGAAGPAAKGALPALTKVAADPKGRNRAEVVEAVGKVAAGDATLVPTLAPLLLDPDAKVRAAAGPALDRVDPKWKSKPAVKALAGTAKGQLTAADAGKRAGGAEVLGLLGDAAQVPALCPVVLDTEPPVRAAAAKALDALDADWRSKPAAKAVAAAAVKQLSAPEARKRFDAVGALEVIRPPTAAVALEQMMTRETDANTLQYAGQVLARLRKGP